MQVLDLSGGRVSPQIERTRLHIEDVRRIHVRHSYRENLIAVMVATMLFAAAVGYLSYMSSGCGGTDKVMTWGGPVCVNAL